MIPVSTIDGYCTILISLAITPDIVSDQLCHGDREGSDRIIQVFVDIPAIDDVR